MSPSLLRPPHPPPPPSASVETALEDLIADVASSLNQRALLAELREVDWIRPDGLDQARERLIARLQQLADAIVQLGSRHAVPVDQVIRNLIASRSRRSAWRVYLLLAPQRVRFGGGVEPWRERYLAKAPDPARLPGVLPLAWDLATSDRRPDTRDLQRLLGDDPIRVLFATALHAVGADTGKARSLDVLRVARAGPPDARAELSEVAAAWKRAGLPPVSEGELTQLPDDLFVELLLDPESRRVFVAHGDVLTQDRGPAQPRRGLAARSQRTTSPRSATSYLDRLEAFVRLFAHDDLATAPAAPGLCAALALATLPEIAIRAGLSAALPDSLQPRAMAPVALGQLSAPLHQRPDARALWTTLLMLVAEPPASRATAIGTLPKAQRQRLLSALSPALVQAFFKHAPSSEDRAALFDAFRKNGETARFVAAMAADASWLSELPVSAIPGAAEAAGADAIWRVLIHYGDSLSLDALPPAVARTLGAHIGALAEAGVLPDAVKPVRSERFVRWLLEGEGGKRNAAPLTSLLCALDNADADPAYAAWRDLARTLLRALPGLPQVVPYGVTTKAFVQLCELTSAEHSEWEPQLLDVNLWRGEPRAWEMLVRESKAPDAVVPEVLSRILPSRPELLALAARKAPERFGALALIHLPLREVIHHALVSFRLARWLDPRLDAAQRRTLLPWIREAHPKAPIRAAAYELAVLCSLSDAHKLYRLAQHLAERLKRGPTRAGQAFDGMYRTYALPKRSGGLRTITAPEGALKRIQRRLLDGLLASVPLHSAATGFRPRYSTVVNASRHVGRKLVVNVDIESCFPSTKYAQILRACRIAAAGALSPRAVRLLAELCSYGGALPTGAPTSPAICNIVLRRSDRAIASAVRRFGIEYTRYADDLTFSGNGEVHRILPFVEKVLEETGYTLAEHKVNLFRRGRRQVVTGLVVNDKPNLPRRLRRRLRAAVHGRTNGRTPRWHGAPVSDSVLLGHLANLHAVQPLEANRLALQVRVATAAAVQPPRGDDA